jgi:ribulose-phosphate 3-epimerase
LERTLEIAPSILAADFAHLAQEIGKVEAAGAKLLHLDIMDGHFVPNITLGPPVVSSIRRVTGLPLDTHLMIGNPEKYIDDFVRAGANWISVHVEVDSHLDRTLHYLKERGVKAGIAINPGTSLSTLDEVLPLADYVLVMTVNPGFGGQRFIPSALKKIRKLKDSILNHGLQTRIEVDGGIGPDNLLDVLTAGAEIIVAGSAVFGGRRGASESFREMKGIADRFMKQMVGV